MTPFRLDGADATPLIPGTTLLEASAGTGKTYTIAGLVVRLILEHDIPLERIAVMTFTRAATAELRDRIRKALGDAARALDQPEAPAEGFTAWLRACHQAAPPATAQLWRRRLRRALDAVDAAAISTIHAFVATVAKDHAAQVGIDPAAPISVDLAPWRDEAVRDWFRRHLRDADARVARLLGNDPLTQLNKVAKTTEHAPLARVITEPLDPAAAGALLDALTASWTAHRGTLETHAQRYLSGLKKNAILHPEKLGSRLDLVDRWLGEGALDSDDRKKLRDLWDQEKLDLITAQGGDPALFRAIQDFLPDRLAGRILAAFARDYHQALAARPTTVRDLHTGDFILALDQALAAESPDADTLAKSIGTRADAVLVDEFQDTDLVQWRILRRCFATPQHRLLLIGDPKQAIYAFRGADVYAYTAARDTVPPERRFTLDTNHRSDEPLVQGLNALYGGAGDLPALADPFAIRGVDYLPVKAAKPLRLDPGTLDPRPVQVWAVDEDVITNKADAEVAVCGLVVAEIARLTHPATGVLIAGKPVGAGDVAVIVRGHAQADGMYRALAEAGIPAVRQDRASVFATPAAEELHAVLAGCLDSVRDTSVRNAAATRLIGAPAEDFTGGTWEALPLTLNALGDLWRREGLAAWWYHLADLDLGWGTPRLRLAGLGDGGRMAMDVLHLVELLARAGTDQALPAEGLLEWFAQQRAVEDTEAGEAVQRRLERDDPAVRLVTVHASKGLQYPIVFEAFAWSGARLADEGGIIHPGDGQAAERHLGALPTAAEAQAEREALGDDLRKLYVGLTRAMHRLYVLWAPSKTSRSTGSSTSALTWLLCGRRNPGTLDADPEHPPFGQVAARYDTGCDLPDLPQVAVTTQGGLPSTIDVFQRLDRPEDGDSRGVFDVTRIARRWQRSSFTGLARLAAHPDGWDDGRDHDEGAGHVPADADEAPGGAALGRLVHGLFEHGDFAAWRADPEALTTLLTQRAAADGLGLTPAQCARLAENCRATVSHRIPGLDLALADLPAPVAARSLVKEWPIRVGLGRSTPLLARLFAGLVPEAPHWPATLGNAVLPAGVFTGVLDALICHGDRYHVLDWKTNRLPAYGPDDLARAMGDEHYFLQAHLYLLAVHRFLKFRRADYDPARHLGGAHYAFLRGARDPAGSRGWISLAPQLALLEALDACC